MGGGGFAPGLERWCPLVAMIQKTTQCFLSRALASSAWRPPAPLPPPAPITPVDQPLLLRLCTVLFQQQNAPDERLDARLGALDLPSPIPHELFLQLCNRFPSSHRPIHRFLLSAGRRRLAFSHSPITLAKFVSVLGRSKNVDLLWSTLLADAPLLSASPSVLLAAVRALAASRQLGKCVQLFGLLSPSLLNFRTLNLSVGSLCGRRLVDEAAAVVSKLRASVPPDGDTHSLLVVRFCRAGSLAAASRAWNRTLEEGFEPGAAAYEEMVVTFFKKNRTEDAMRMFKTFRSRRFGDMGAESYGAVIEWASRRGGIRDALMVFGEMTKRGIADEDNKILGALVFGLLMRRKVREGYKVLEGAKVPDVSLFHGLMKGLLWLKRPGEATVLFRRMISSGLEPTMHTYVMLLRGHMGRKGRKGSGGDVGFDSIFVGGLVKAGRMAEARKYVERVVRRGTDVPRFDYNRFLHCFSDEDGVAMFEQVGRRLREAGMVDLGDIFSRYGEKMATRDRRRRRRRIAGEEESIEESNDS